MLVSVFWGWFWIKLCYFFVYSLFFKKNVFLVREAVRISASVAINCIRNQRFRWSRIDCLRKYKARAMASFRIHEDRENASLGHRKENADAVFSAAQRRALGDLSQFACNQNRSLKLVSNPCMFIKVVSKFGIIFTSLWFVAGLGEWTV